MGNPEKHEPQPIEDYCCGAYCSDAGCCRFDQERDNQKEMFPDDINKYGNFQDPYYPPRGEARGKDN